MRPGTLRRASIASQTTTSSGELGRIEPSDKSTVDMMLEYFNALDSYMGRENLEPQFLTTQIVFGC